MIQDELGKLRLKLVAITLAFSFIPLFSLGLALYDRFYDTYSDKVYGSLSNLVENKKVTIDLFLAERMAQLSTLAQTESYRELSTDPYLEHIFGVLQLHGKSFLDLQVIDQNGICVSYVGPYKLRGIDYSHEEWFHQVMAKGIHVSDVFLGFRKYPHFNIAVSRREGDKTWVLRAAIDSDIFDSLVRSIHLGKSGDAFILSSDHVLQTKPRFGHALFDTLIFPEIPHFSGTRVESLTIDGQTSLYAMAWLNHKDWLLIIKDDPREELLPVLRARWLLILLLSGGTLVIIGGAVFIANGTVRELIRAEREKATLDASLTQSSKMAALGKLAAGVAHEVNNPLAIIMEKAGWMRDLLGEEDIKASPNFQEFEDAVAKIEFHVRRAKDVTHRLLGFARRMEPTQEDIDVNLLLDQTRSFLENEASFRGITFLSDYQKDLPRIASDTSQLQQVFLNIMDNAIDAIDKNGSITVTTRAAPDVPEVEIVIADTGKGMSKEAMAKIFDPFFTTKKVGEGTGLGLTISYSIIKKLGGRIEVTSEEGRGTAFHITLPVGA
ncbi:integral membrane sensor signal transduction histidine kinase [Solidesulfovibrio carbinoliphilus subsp. oakridgensis]|uniref:histidine kinase n=1 Tax=Solidesulfovibrio carbinoliphilus subsp. oakridgensis TaxID=694327 RepID=G7QBG8_9BACT|nr:PAS domain-containing sensor histidine kinase [Solidesulfovibrio carbinoliphilus]EHJ49391.1 integral membrane sensor signal transduction histidine kinase [Solidesulfovibrio carbinoliphilus subsp. oakridgensis]